MNTTLVLDLDALDFTRGNGLVTVVAQDAATGAILMVAHADRDALARTIASGELHLFSRTRGPWHKGATSGNILRVEALAADCDGDAVLARVHPTGPACHTGARSCFGAAPVAGALGMLDEVVAARARDPEPPGYTGRLLGDRNLRLKKLGEEALELAVACADGDASRAAEEAADLLYPTVVALHATGVGVTDVLQVLDVRHRDRTS